jgi:hypothetical protein
MLMHMLYRPSLSLEISTATYYRSSVSAKIFPDDRSLPNHRRHLPPMPTWKWWPCARLRRTLQYLYRHSSNTQARLHDKEACLSRRSRVVGLATYGRVGRKPAVLTKYHIRCPPWRDQTDCTKRRTETQPHSNRRSANRHRHPEKRQYRDTTTTPTSWQGLVQHGTVRHPWKSS